MTADSIPMEAANLIAQLVSANVDSLAATTDRIIDGLTERATVAEATLAAVRDRIGCLLGGDYQPSGSALERALWPTVKIVNEYREPTS